MSNPISGTFTATGESENFVPASQLRRGRFNISIWGTFTGTVEVQRSFDAGSTWIPVASPDLGQLELTVPVSLSAEETEQGVRYRLACTAYTSGTINYRMSR
ncbi:MAG: hypothetical protein Q7T61_00440 [Caulobacter sp.]|nr:hypothetical protein [Caulobacter sp.]